MPSLVGRIQALVMIAVQLALGGFLAVAVSATLLLQFVSGPARFCSRKNRDHLAKVLQDPKLGTHGFVTSQGVRLHYVELGDRSKPLMLFIHGFPEFWYMWRRQMQDFAGTHHCVAFDMRGYNDSEKPPGVHNYARDVLVEDVRQVIVQLKHSRATLVAHDWGGIVACNFAADRPDMVEKLILTNTTYSPAFARVLATPAQLSKSWYIFMFQLPRLPELALTNSDGRALSGMFKKSHSREDIELLKFAFLKPGACTSALNFYRALLRITPSRLSGPEPVRKITVPTLLVWGKKDFALGLPVAESFRTFCDNLQLVYQPEATHWVVAEQPEALTQEMRRFVK